MPPAQAPLELDEPATVTLITGDEVTVHPGNTVSITPADGREHMDFEEINDGVTIRVVPADAKRLLAEGKLDKRLFDVSYLVREGYADRETLPLIIEGNEQQIDDLAAGPDAAMTYESDQLQLAAVEQDRAAEEAPLWSQMTNDGATAPKLPDGVDKIWLDGMAHVTLDESVPQIGAPEVWESGYTGKGVTVAVLDTGIDTTHPDLAGTIAASEVFAETRNGGRFDVTQLDEPISWIWLARADRVPVAGTSDPLVYVGRACVDSEGDELLADPAGKTALVARDQGACTLAEKFDTVVEDGATGVVIFNDVPGMFRGTISGAEHAGAAWGAGISDVAGAALIDLLDGGEEVVLEFTDQPLIGDLHGHGTHVASTIAGTGAASDGARKGVAPDATIISGQVCDDRGFCPNSATLAGMEWAVENGADVINMSLGGGPTDGTDPLSQAVNTLTESHDVLFVIAAGNSGAWGIGSVGAPGVADAALTVGASDRDDAVAWFSSRGPRLPDFVVKPNVVAPGVDIVAARAYGTTRGTPVDDHYTALSGTSMATPHVAGTAALLTQARPELTAGQLKDALASTAVDLGELWTKQGTGRIDVARAVYQGVYADASVNFGVIHEDNGPVERTITYTNHTDRTVNLTLDTTLTSVGGTDSTALSLSRKRVTVRAHNSATITVTIDPASEDIAHGPYGGAVTATANGISLRTAIGLGVEKSTPPLAADWDETWTATYKYAHGEYPGWTNGMKLRDAEMSPDGTQLFLTGTQAEAGDGAKLTTAAIDAVTGDELWVAHHAVSNVVTGSRIASIAVSPDGGTVFVAHDIWDEEHGRRDSLLLAYNNALPEQLGDPEPGEQLWQASYQDMGLTRFHASHGVMRIAVTPDGQTVVMVATKALSDSEYEMHTIAYDAGTGEQIWTAVNGEPGHIYAGRDLAIDPAGELVYVTGFEQQDPSEVSVNPITIAYELTGDSPGSPRWVSRHDSPSGKYGSWHNSVSEDGQRVFVAASVKASETPFDLHMQTMSLDAATGEVQWYREFGASDHGYGPGHTEPAYDIRGAITVGPHNDLVYITGRHAEGSGWAGRKATIVLAYSQQSGELAWSDLAEVQAAGTPDATDFLPSAALSPEADRLYVTGSIGPFLNKDQLTMAYNTTSGERLAVARHDHTDDTGDQLGRRTFVSPDGATIYSIASVFPRDTFAYWGLTAYQSPIILAADARRFHGDWQVNLTWSGTTEDQIDVYRDGEVISTIDDTGAYIDNLGHQRRGTTFAYKACVAGTTQCSKETIITIGGRPPRR